MAGVPIQTTARRLRVLRAPIYLMVHRGGNFAETHGGMVWFFHREGAFARYETQSGADDQWELLVVEPDGTERIERFATARELDERQRALTHNLLTNGWSGPHGRLL